MINSLVSLVTDASLTVLSERVHRGSLNNARRALDERLTPAAFLPDSAVGQADLALRGAVVHFRE